MAFSGQSPPPRRARRFALPAGSDRYQRLVEQGRKPMTGDRTIAPLRPSFVAGDGHDTIASPRSDSRKNVAAGRFRNGDRAGDIPRQGNPTRRPIGMLAARAAGRIEGPFEFGFRDDEAAEAKALYCGHDLTVVRSAQTTDGDSVLVTPGSGLPTASACQLQALPL